jgi:hypothetical protein
MAAHKGDSDRSAESRRILERVARDSSGLLGRTVARARDHFGAADADQADRVELWGTLIGRAIGAVALCAVLLWAASMLASGA